MSATLRLTMKAGGAALALALAVALGYVAASSQGAGSLVGEYERSTSSATLPLAGQKNTVATTGDADSAQWSAGSAESASSPSADRLVVTTASMALRVRDLDDSVHALRSAVASAGGQVTELTMSAGDDRYDPVPVEGLGSDRSDTGPSSARMAVKVPADRLVDVERAAAGLGTVLSQSASESDVTQQHVDLAARLKNLRAEEERLRRFLDKASNVGEMLQVERELSRVRGEIEAMQAELAYLERQAAMATLTISLTQPGAVVRPAGTSWGLGEAVTVGVQAAAAVVRTLVTAAIALSPVILAALVAWALWRVARRRRAGRMTSAGETAA